MHASPITQALSKANPIIRRLELNGGGDVSYALRDDHRLLVVVVVQTFFGRTIDARLTCPIVLKRLLVFLRLKKVERHDLSLFANQSQINVKINVQN